MSFTPKPSTGFGVGTSLFSAPMTASSGSLSFGTTTSTSSAAPTFNFGSTPTSSTTTTTTGINPTGSLLSNTGIPAASSNLFGNPASTAAPLSSTFNFGNLTPATSATFGTTTSAPTLGLGGAATSSLYAPNSTSSMFGTTPTAASLSLTTTANTTTSKGLGGLDVSISNKGLSHGSTSPTVAKENLIPNELTQAIDSFKEFVKTQKSFSSDIARGSARPLNRCAEDTASLMEILTSLAGSVQRDRSLVDKLKQDTAKALQNAEIAQRTHDTPAGLQYENNAPLLFFMELAEIFEQDLMLFRSQIETTEKHIRTMISPKALTPQELTSAMSKIHESLVAVAGRLQGVHAKVQQHKEQYLNLRKYVLKDSANVFEDSRTNGKCNRSSFGKVTSGPTPFSPGNKSFLSSTTINSGRQPSYGTINPLAWAGTTPVPTASCMTINSSIKPPTSGLNFNQTLNLTGPLNSSVSSPNFQLQKPPLNKRGKH